MAPQGHRSARPVHECRRHRRRRVGLAGADISAGGRSADHVRARAAGPSQWLVDFPRLLARAHGAVVGLRAHRALASILVRAIDGLAAAARCADLRDGFMAGHSHVPAFSQVAGAIEAFASLGRLQR